MTKDFWSKEDDAEIDRQMARGATYDEAGRAVGKSGQSVRSRLKRRADAGQDVGFSQAKARRSNVRPEPSQDAKDMEIAALRAQLNRQEVKKPPPVTCELEDDPEEDPAAAWAKAEADGDRHIRKALLRSRFKADFSSERKPVALTFVSDQHIAPGTPCAIRRMREDAELIAATGGMYAMLGGDGVDNHIVIRAAVLAQRTQPSDQFKLFNHYLSIFQEKICVLISGNHEAWTNQVAGIDPLCLLAQQRRLHYAPAVARLDVNVGGQSYRVGLRHQYRMNSSFNQTHAVKQWMRLGDEDFDIGVVCHHHEYAVETCPYRGKNVVVMRPGSYQLLSAYSAQYGFNNAVPMCPTVLLWPGERKMLAIPDVREAAEILTLLRS